MASDACFVRQRVRFRQRSRRTVGRRGGAEGPVGVPERWHFNRLAVDGLERDGIAPEGFVKGPEKGRTIVVANRTGRDVVAAVYKVQSETYCPFTKCKLERSVRVSPHYDFPAVDQAVEQLVRYVPLSASERARPGIRLFLFWSYLPLLKPDDKRPTLVDMQKRAVAVGKEFVENEKRKALEGKPLTPEGVKDLGEREEGIQRRMRRKSLQLVNEFWPRLRDIYYNPDSPLAPPVRLMVQESLLPIRIEEMDADHRESIEDDPKKNRYVYVAALNGPSKVRIDILRRPEVFSLYIPPSSIQDQRRKIRQALNQPQPAPTPATDPQRSLLLARTLNRGGTTQPPLTATLDREPRLGGARFVGRLGGAEGPAPVVTLPSHWCVDSLDCAGSGYGDTCRSERCACTKDAECGGVRGKGWKCIGGQCRLTPSCGFFQDCPVGYNCRESRCIPKPPFRYRLPTRIRIAGSAAFRQGSSGRYREGGLSGTSVASACLRHPILCGRLGISSLRLLKNRGLYQKGGPSPESLAEIRALLVKIIVLLVEDTHAMRDLLVRLELDPSWISCFGFSQASLLNPERFELDLYSFLQKAAQVSRADIEGFKREIRTSGNKSAAKERLRAYLDSHLLQLQQTLLACRTKPGPCLAYGAQFQSCLLMARPFLRSRLVPIDVDDESDLSPGQINVLAEALLYVDPWGRRPVPRFRNDRFL